MKNKVKMSTIMPVLLAIYLAVMAWVGRHRLADGEYFYYYGVIGVCLVIIVTTHFVLKKREYYRQKRREEAEYGSYDNQASEEKDAEPSKDSDSNEN